MDALSNAECQIEEVKPQSVRFVPNTIPEARSSKTGVSIKYVPDKNKKWFVFRVSYGRENKASDYLVEDGTYTYIAKKWVVKYEHGRRKKYLQTLIPNLVFAYTTIEKAEEYVKKTPALAYLSYYYNHFKLDENQKNPPLLISSKEMKMFIKATCNQNEHLLFVGPSQVHYKNGELVRVIDGPFKGVEGRVARVSGQQRIVVNLFQLGLVSTAYIPSAFIEVINSH